LKQISVDPESFLNGCEAAKFLAAYDFDHIALGRRMASIKTGPENNEFASLPTDFATVGKLESRPSYLRMYGLASRKKLSLPVCHAF
jgi:hypothetical protein